MQIPEHFFELSVKMSEVLDDSGAGKHTVMERRKTYLWRECMEKIVKQLSGRYAECFHFGSQSEGTTIPGHQSDIDFLFTDNNVNIMRVWGDWEAGMTNFLMLHDETTPPQQYLLQEIRKDTPEPETSLCNELQVRKDSGQVLLSAERCKQDLERQAMAKGKVTKNGPSVSSIHNWDVVSAFQISKPLPEIHNWIDRYTGRHWPPPKLLEAARKAPCFLVAAGHPDSDYTREEWRLSPNLIERMLMFSFNMTQIKCYIVLKSINKSIFAHYLEESITSFHCKTIMFYTIERTQPSLWCDHNLMFLLWLCLHVLRKLLRLGRFPHYIIEGVNLFDGKLSKVQQRRLLVFVETMIKNNLQDVFNIVPDRIGCRLRACSLRQIVQGDVCHIEIDRTGRILQAYNLPRILLRRVCVRNSISLLLQFDCLKTFVYQLRDLLHEIHKSNTTFDIKYVLRNIYECFTNVRLKTVGLEIIKHVYASENSRQSSKCLRLRNVLDSNIIRRFKYSLNTDVASNRLKLASILYSSGHLQATVRVLEDVERRYHSKVKNVCGFVRLEMRGVSDLHVIANRISGNSGIGLSEPPFSLCVNFDRQESYCTPFMLLFEMNRNFIKEEVAHRHIRFPENKWMDNAEVDALPLLHYLQYLTYGGLGERDKQLHALEVLESYISDTKTKINLYHMETALNLLGHCYEMEGNYFEASLCYMESLIDRCINNAANWHIRRVLPLLSG